MIRQCKVCTECVCVCVCVCVRERVCVCMCACVCEERRCPPISSCPPFYDGGDVSSRVGYITDSRCNNF